ncbi:MAG: hypothetical protein LBG80_15385 [Bacteroidales bacterium]|jgi:hypothetical protein|nr:hypothetical protein [Bacteroidales bacterium]
MKILKIIRQFERFNFHGVSEEPEQSFERDSNHQFPERLTGKSIHSSTNEIDSSNATLVGYIVDDFENKIERFERVEN